MRTLHQHQQGIGLLELMISITLGLFLLSGAIGVLMSSKSSYNLNNELTWIQDNARFATNSLTRDIRMAGFYGCSTSQNYTSTLNPSAGTGWYTDFDNAVIDVVDNDPPTSATIDISGTHPFVAGDILVITDCSQTTVFQVTGNNSNKLVHNTGSGTPGNCTKFLGGISCSSAGANRKIFRGSEGAFVVQMKAHAYYVDEAADGTPTLYRRELVANSGNPDVSDEELVQGVENIQVVYGYDSDADGNANRYVNADDVPVADWGNVVTVRIHLLLRSFQQAATEPQEFRFVGADYMPVDRFLRQEFISTIDLRNKG